jgi:hypothetical protein
MASELCELRDRDLYFSLAESRDLLANFGVEVAAGDLALLHQRSEGWAAALQMVALSLRGSADPVRVVRALDVRSYPIAEYFIAEVLEQQAPEVAQFMLNTSILGELTADACGAVTGLRDAAALLRRIDTANLFTVALDDERTSFRYHHLVRQVLRAELRARDRAGEQKLQLRAGEWFESIGDTRRAARHYLAAQQPERALALIQDRVLTNFLHDPVLPAAPDLSTVDPSLLANAPDRLLALAADLLTWGDTARGGEYLDLLEHAQPTALPDPELVTRSAVMRSFHYGVTGQLDEAVSLALAVRASQGRTPLTDDWNITVPLILLRLYNCLEDYQAVEREAVAAVPRFGSPGWLSLGGRRPGWVGPPRKCRRPPDCWRRCRRLRPFLRRGSPVRWYLAGNRESLISRNGSPVSMGRRPLFEFLTLLDRARIWAARGQVREALASVEAARLVLPGAAPVLLAQADELEALLRLSLGDLRSAAELADRLPAARRCLLLAKIALATDDHHAAQEHLRSPSLCGLTPRRALERQVLLPAAATGAAPPAARSWALHRPPERFLNRRGAAPPGGR